MRYSILFYYIYAERVIEMMRRRKKKKKSKYSREVCLAGN